MLATAVGKGTKLTRGVRNGAKRANAAGQQELAGTSIVLIGEVGQQPSQFPSNLDFT